MYILHILYNYFTIDRDQKMNLKSFRDMGYYVSLSQGLTEYADRQSLDSQRAVTMAMLEVSGGDDHL